MEGRLGHAVMSAGRPGETFLYVDVNASGAAPGAGVAAPVNLAIVIDHSGSMKGQRLQNAIQAARGMIGRLRDGDTVSVVGYSGDTEVLVPATTIGPGTRAQVLAQVQPMATRGNTCMSCGIEAGMRMLSQRAGAVNRMLVLSDGEANRGVRDVAGLRALAADVRRRGASISSIGVDVDYNERVMFALARESNGRHHFVEDAARLDRAFDAELQSLVKSVADKASLSIELDPGVILEEVFDRSFQQIGSRVIVPLGMFTAQDKKTVLMRLNTPTRPDGELPIAAVDLTYDDLAGAKQGSCHGELAAQLTSDAARVSELDPIVMGRVTRSETVAALAEANELFAAGDETRAREQIQAQLQRVRKRKQKWNAQPKAEKWSGEDPFDGIESPLESAGAGFSAKPASRAGRAQVRQNAADMDELSL
ncbi:MAG: VWA domain-containing protein [Myxococcales bacterium]|nr:VWA domain-containing protein [Myxococcales bacterium]